MQCAPQLKQHTVQFILSTAQPTPTSSKYWSFLDLSSTVLNFLVTFALSSLILACLEQQITTEAKQQITDKLPLKLLCFVNPELHWLI